MNKAAFIDRDGVINNDTGHYYIYKPKDFVLNSGVLEGLKLLQENGFKLILISNQGGVSKGIYTKEDVATVHQYFNTLLEKEGITFSEMYYCPHHNSKENCFCRKPQGLMIEKAVARFNINKQRSFMIGDNPKDIECANNAEIAGFKMEKNSDFLEMVKQIIDLK